MSIFSKLGITKELDPKKRSEAFAKELTNLTKKYHCHIEIRHAIDIFPDPIEPTQPTEEKK